MPTETETPAKPKRGRAKAEPKAKHKAQAERTINDPLSMTLIIKSATMRGAKEQQKVGKTMYGRMAVVNPEIDQLALLTPQPAGAKSAMRAAEQICCPVHPKCIQQELDITMTSGNSKVEARNFRLNKIIFTTGEGGAPQVELDYTGPLSDQVAGFFQEWLDEEVEVEIAPAQQSFEFGEDDSEG